jgi:uncharacterized membrane protein
MIGFLAIITLVVLVTSPGGPFDTSQAEGEAGLNVFLVLPVGILITLASTMLIYAYGIRFVGTRVPFCAESLGRS